MRIVSTAIMLATLALGGAEHAHAQCTFDAPAKAKGIKSTLVRTHVSCPSFSPFVPYVNSSTSAGIPSCAPPYPLSLYQFDAKGSCSVQLSQTVEAPCPDGSEPSCAVFYIALKCRGLLDPGGDTLTDTAGWALHLLGRSTIDDPANGDMTLIDFPVTIPLPAAAAGTIKTKLPLVDPCDFLNCGPHPSYASPPCTQYQLLKLSLHDPAGNSFAVLGSSAR